MQPGHMAEANWTLEPPDPEYAFSHFHCAQSQEAEKESLYVHAQAFLVHLL